MDRRKYLTIMSSVIVLSFMLLLTQKIDPGWYFKIMIISAGLGVTLLFCYFWSRIVKIFKRVAIQDLLFAIGAILSGLLITTLLLAICKPFLELTPAYYRFGLTLLIGSLSIGLTTLLVRLRMKELKAVFLIEAIPTKAQTGIRNQLKVVDTSAIIDGRIADLCKTGFLEGVLIIPTFVIAELQKIADSADTLRRNRGRRGLDLLNRIQKEKLIATRIFDRDYEDLNEVDTKLLRLAREIEAKVVTNDFNLNKVAEIYGVQVLNINELSNAIKPAVLPGEEMAVHVLRDGKEMGQGIGYLEDGTMIVVEGGKDYIGLDIEIQVTSVLQTAAGRMIFAKPKEYLMVKITS